ncbi:hypothetical protein [Spiroplasma poulsonii]|uniref:hypothetical protein n=1 Tax=Spiroplasma poulsonii TaxID=2138 RepID=UPI001F4CBA32|nr:hypothetical protein [Spiroplasma poulsonii]UNF61945.1 hypothetical protein MNU24_00290 [Spiroplasma poulsonii]
MVKALINDYFNVIKLLLLMLPKKPNQRPKRHKTILFLVKRKNTRSKTQVIIEQETKNYCNKFFAWKKNMIMFYLKNQNPNFKKYQINIDSGYQGIQKITITF